VNFALVSATNQKLKEKVESGEFRSDLYYRLNGLSVALPALRDRTDLQALIDVILQVEQTSDINISPKVMGIFKTHPWPGNIRQLHNVLRTALALADGEEVAETHLTQDFIDELQDLNLGNVLRPKIAASQTLALEDLAEDAIRSTMQQHAGNVSAVARQLGISRNTLYRKLKLIGLIS